MNTTSQPKHPPKIRAQERANRIAAVNYARGSVRLEGFILSEEVEEINRRFINGELSVDEHMESIKAAVGLDKNK